MFHQALKRLFLILFPVILFVTALFLSYFHPRQQDIGLQNTKQSSAKNCPFYLGVSFFPQQIDFQKNKLTSYLLPESAFIKKTQDLKLYFQKENMDLEQIFFVLPLTLTKEEEWIASQKTLFILPTGERKQISHLTYSEINNFHKNSDKDYKALKLDMILSSLPKNSHFLFYLQGSNREKIIKNLERIPIRIKGNLYLSSSNEKLLKELLLLKTDSNSFLKTKTKILRSFKTFIRLEILSVFPQSFKQIEGEGIITANSFPLSQDILSLLKQKNKLLFFEKDPPYTEQDKYWIKNSQALISSQTQLAISSIKNKKTCLIKN